MGMLVLQRKIGEAVVIATDSGEKCRVTVQARKDGSFRLGFEGTPGMTIMREELLDGSKCPTCRSPSPELHPAMQFEGEVQPCKDPWHGEAEQFVQADAIGFKHSE